MADEVIKPTEQQAAEKKAADNKPLSAAGVTFLNSALGIDATKAKGDKGKEKTDGEKVGDKGAKADTETPPKKKPAPKATPAAQPAIDLNEMAATVATAVVKATTKENEAPKKEEPTGDEKLFSDPAEARKLKVLAQMEKQWPDKYKGVSESYKSGIKKLKAYADKWELDNPGKEFDESAPEHEEFVKSISESVGWDDDDYTETLADLKAESKAEERLKKELEPVRADLDQFKRERKIREELPKIQSAAATAGNHFWETLGEGFEGIIDDKGAIDTAKVKELAESNPIAHDEAVSAVKVLEQQAATLYCLSHGLEVFSDKNASHVAIANFALQCEQRMLTRSPDKMFDAEGRKFVTKEQYLGMTKAEQNKHWTFDDQDLSLLLAADVAKKAKKKIADEEEKFARIAKARNIEFTPKVNKRAETKTEENEENELEDGGKPVSPSARGSSRMAVAKEKGGGGAKSPAEVFIKRGLGIS